MKRIIIMISCCLSVGMASPLMTFAEEPERTGLFGDVLIGGGWSSSRPSGLEVIDDNERLDSLTARGRRQNDGLLQIGGEIGYAFEETGTALSIGMGFDEGLNFSVSQELGGAGQLRLSALYAEVEVWKNPYQTAVTREKTDAESIGVSVAWKDIFATGVWLSYEQMQVDVKQDLIGQSQTDLRRDGTDRTLEIGFMLPLGENGILSSSINYMKLDRDGASNSGNGFGGAVVHAYELDRFSFETALNFSQIDYDKSHPVFNKTRNESTYVISETVAYAAPFGFEDCALVGFAGYSETDANITFFDSSGSVVGTGVIYSF